MLLAMIVPGSPAALRPLEWGILLGFVLLGAGFWTWGAAMRRETQEAERAALILGGAGDVS